MKRTALLRKTPLRKKSLKTKRKPKVTAKSVLETYGLPENYQKSHLRYKNPIEKGVYWYWLSLYIRTRDLQKYGTCISCGKQVFSISDLQAGHYAPAGNCGFALLFDESNINAECGRCNGLDEGHLIGYERGFVERYGQATMDALKQRYFNKHMHLMKEWNRAEYVQKIAEIRAKLEAL